MSVHGFCKNRRTEGRTFIVGVNEITFTHVRETLRHFENKACRGEVCALRKGVHHLQSCLFLTSNEKHASCVLHGTVCFPHSCLLPMLLYFRRVYVCVCVCVCVCK
jgi:hypothetical protein